MMELPIPIDKIRYRQVQWVGSSCWEKGAKSSGAFSSPNPGIRKGLAEISESSGFEELFFFFLPSVLSLLLYVS